MPFCSTFVKMKQSEKSERVGEDETKKLIAEMLG